MIAVILIADAAGPAGPVAGAIKLLLLPLQVWGLCVLAHIVRVALESPLVVGIAVSTTYYLVDYLFLEQLFPATVG